MPRLRILIVCDHYPTYGTRSVATLASKLAELNHDVLVASTTSGIFGEKLDQNNNHSIRVVRLASFSIPLAPYSYTPRAGNHLLKLAQSYKPDVIHSHFLMYWMSLSSQILSKKGWPLHLTLHGFTLPEETTSYLEYAALFSLYHTLGMKLVNHTSNFICVSSEVRRKFLSQFPSKENSTNIVPIGISPKELAKRETKSTSEILEKYDLENKRIFLFVGRIVKEKGIFEIVHAFRKLRSLRDDVGLFLLGDGHDSALVRKQLSRIPDAYLVGFQDDVGSYLAASDIFLLPSYREGLPTALLEAMFFEKSIISTRVGGINDLMKNGAKITIVKKRSWMSLYNAMNMMTNYSDNEIAVQGSMNRDVVLRHYTWDVLITQLLSMYEHSII